MGMSEREEEELSELESAFEKLHPGLALQLCASRPRLVRACASTGYALCWMSLLTIGLGLLLANPRVIIVGLVAVAGWPLPLVIPHWLRDHIRTSPARH
jgi:hypothetical protein